MVDAVRVTLRPGLRRRAFPAAGLIAGLILTAGALGAQQLTEKDAPGPLSAAHAGKPGLKECLLCHNADLVVEPKKCLACHAEIAVRIESKRGFHRDKADGCADCHAEHGGPDARLFDLDPKTFDHSETGTVHSGAHAKVADCRTCHTRERTIARKTTTSFLFKESGCAVCHASPHPEGRQRECQACHTPKSWRVDIWKERST